MSCPRDRIYVPLLHSTNRSNSGFLNRVTLHELIMRVLAFLSTVTPFRASLYNFCPLILMAENSEGQLKFIAPSEAIEAGASIG